MRNLPSSLAAGAGLRWAGAGLPPCTSVLPVHALVRGRAAGGAEEASDASIDAVVDGPGAGCGGGGLADGDDEPPNQPENGFQPLADCFGAAGAEGSGSLPQA